MQRKSIRVTNDLGRTFAVKLLRKGDHYGLNNCITHDEDDPLVEFYDATYKKGFDKEGQFVSRYYLSTLREGRNDGLCLYGGCADVWYVTGDNMRDVLAAFAKVRLPTRKKQR